MIKQTSQCILSLTAAIAFIAVTLPQPVEAARQRPQGQARTSVSKPVSAEGRAGGGAYNAARASNNQVANKQVSNRKNVNNVRGGNNNVNIDNSRDVNVNVDGGRGGYYDNDHHYHPIATAAAVTATVAVTAAVVGSIVSASQMPPSCVQVMRYNTAYMQCGSTWYQPQYQGSSVTYIVVNQP